MIVSKYDSRVQNGVSYYLAVQHDGRLQFVVVQSCCLAPAGDVYVTITSDNPVISLGVFTHVAGVWRGTNQLELYVNGQQVAGTVTTQGTLTAMVDNSVPVNIGRGESASGTIVEPFGHFDGLIDEVEDFDRALSAADIQAIFNAGSAGKCKPCVQPPADLVSIPPASGWLAGLGRLKDG